MTKEATTRDLVAADLLVASHPLHKAFAAWAKPAVPSRRQARKFLQAHPQYRVVQVAKAA